MSLPIYTSKDFPAGGAGQYWIYQALYELYTNPTSGGASQEEIYEIFNGTNPQGESASLFANSVGLADYAKVISEKLTYSITNESAATLLDAIRDALETGNLLTVTNRLEAGGSTVAQSAYYIKDYLYNGSKALSVASLLGNINDYLLKETPNLINAPQDISDNTNVTSTTTGLTNVDTTLYTVTAGKKLRLTDIQFSYTVTAAATIYIRDGAGGTILATVQLAATTGTFSMSFRKPKNVSTSLYYDYISGTITNFNIVCAGYEKP